jgi:hypothetical protein
VKGWLKKGRKVKIMTARVSPEGHSSTIIDQQHDFIYDWTLKVFGQPLEATYKKDLHMIVLMDDRALQVYPNTGETLEERIESLERLVKLLVFKYNVPADPINNAAGYKLV